MCSSDLLKLLGYGEAHAYRIMRIFKSHDEEGLHKLYELWGDDQAYGLSVRQSVEDLKRVLRDDKQDEDMKYRLAWEEMRGAEERVGRPEIDLTDANSLAGESKDRQP